MINIHRPTPNLKSPADPPSPSPLLSLLDLTLQVQFNIAHESSKANAIGSNLQCAANTYSGAKTHPHVIVAAASFLSQLLHPSSR